MDLATLDNSCQNTARMFDQYQRIIWQMPDISLHNNIVCRQTFLKCSTSPKLASPGCVHHDLCSTTSSRRLAEESKDPTTFSSAKPQEWRRQQKQAPSKFDKLIEHV